MDHTIRVDACRATWFHEANGFCGGIPLQSLHNSTALHKLHEIVLRDAGRDVSSTVNRKVCTPWQGQVQSDERRLLVAELCVPKVVW